MSTSCTTAMTVMHCPPHTAITTSFSRHHIRLTHTSVSPRPSVQTILFFSLLEYFYLYMSLHVIYSGFKKTLKLTPKVYFTLYIVYEYIINA